MTTEILHDHLVRVTLPMRGAPPSVNVYLLRGQRGWILIDTGMPYCAFTPPDLERIVLTHMHADHSGLAVELRRQTRAPVWMHRDDTALLHDLKSDGVHASLLRRQMEKARTPGDMAEAVVKSAGRLLELFPAFTPDDDLPDGKRFDSALGPLEVIHTPGHSPGHCCLWLEQPGWLIAGDHVLEKTPPHVGFIPGRDALADYASTLGRLRELPAKLILPGHGSPFTGLNEALERIENHQKARAARIQELLADGPRTAHEIVTSLFTRVSRPGDYHFALTAVLAHLER
ncbi:MAG: MBL fold metallo-hydrolase [Bryobacteraceae bacterium]|nr:MBL fold metallo-hydrolase [Bryobacteraceae bacterium]